MISTGHMLHEVGIRFHRQDENSDKGGAEQGGGGAKRPNCRHKDLTCHRCVQKGHIAPNCHSKPESDAYIHTQDGDESPAGDTDTIEVSSMTDHMANDISHSASKEAKQILIKSIQETTDTSDGAAYNMTYFLGFNSCHNSVAYAIEAFNLANVGIPNTLVLLNSQSTVHQMCNPELVSNFQQGPGYIAVHCTTGVARTSTVGNLPSFDRDDTWIFTNGIANVLSLALVRNRYLITYNSALQGDPPCIMNLAKDRTV